MLHSSRQATSLSPPSLGCRWTTRASKWRRARALRRAPAAAVGRNRLRVTEFRDRGRQSSSLQTGLGVRQSTPRLRVNGSPRRPLKHLLPSVSALGAAEQVTVFCASATTWLCRPRSSAIRTTIAWRCMRFCRCTCTPNPALFRNNSFGQQHISFPGCYVRASPPIFVPNRLTCVTSRRYSTGVFDFERDVTADHVFVDTVSQRLIISSNVGNAESAYHRDLPGTAQASNATWSESRWFGQVFARHFFFLYLCRPPSSIHCTSHSNRDHRRQSSFALQVRSGLVAR